MAARKLPSPARLLIVKAIAHGFTPTEVVALIEKEFGITITRQTVEHYDATKSRELSPKLRELFFEQNRQAREQLDNISLESQAYRQLARCKLLESCKDNPSLQLQIIESAGKEASGGFIAKPRKRTRVIANPNTGRPPSQERSYLEYSVEELEQEARRFRAMADKVAAQHREDQKRKAQQLQAQRLQDHNQ